MDSVSTPPPQEQAPNMDVNYSSINNDYSNAEILKLKKKQLCHYTKIWESSKQAASINKQKREINI